MICKKCGYDVPSGIDYCTNCGEPMPVIKTEEQAEPAPNLPVIDRSMEKKVFVKNYVPHSARLCIHTAAIISCFYSLLNVASGIFYISLDKALPADFVLMGVSLLVFLLTLGMEIKKNLFCAVAVTAVALIFSIYCLAVFSQITFIWIISGIIGCYGAYHCNKLWKAYQKTGILPPKVD